MIDTLLNHVLVLIVVVPLIAAPICFMLPSGRAPWAWATLVSWLVLLAAVAMVGRVLAQGPLSYHLGGWEPPWGIEYRVDALNAFVALLIAVIGSVVLPYARRSVEDEVVARNLSGFYAAYLLVLTGLLGITVTGDVFNLFVFLEISSLSSYVLVSQGRNRRALVAAFRYLVMGTIGATFILIGIGLLYAMTGTLNMADLAERLAAVQDSRTIHTAFAFIIVGVGIKLALFPLHQWLPDAYTHAPSVVSAFIAATATKVAVYVLVRFLFTIFGVEYSFEHLSLASVLIPLAVAGILIGSWMAILQQDTKRLLAYSSVAQVGYMLLGIALATSAGLAAAAMHLFNHALMKGALFMALGCVALRIGATTLDGFAGLGRRMPLTMAAFVLGGLSLIGIPLTVGFISKWYLLVAVMQLELWWLVAVIVVGSLLALVYIGRVVELAYFRAPAEGGRCEAPWSMLVPLWVLVLANIYFGIDTRLTVGLATEAAAMLLGGAL